MTRRRSDRRGVALVLVLWLVVLLGVVATAVLAATRSEAHLLANARARAVGRAAAESGIVAGVALLERRLTTAATPTQRILALSGLDRELDASLRDVALGDGRLDVAFANLNARIDLNQADPAVLLGLFAEFLPPAAARSVLDALQDWRDGDDLTRPFGAERDAYRRSGSPFVPRNGPLRRLDEFDRIRGVSDPFALAIAPYVTVDGDLRIDVNAAPESVLAAIPGVGPAGARALVSRRRQGGIFATLSEVQAVLGHSAGTAASRPLPGLAVAPSRLLLVSRGWQAGHPLIHEIQAAYAVVGRQLVLQSWREHDR